MKQIKVNGVIHKFPDDATDDEINELLGGQGNTMEQQPAQISQEEQWGNIQKQHPFLAKISEHLQGMPGLEAAGNAAGHFNRAVEGTGLPNLAKGFFEGNADLIRGVGNLLPGVNIPKQRGASIPETNPMIQQLSESLGSLGTAVPAMKGYQAIEKGAKSLPYLKNAPEALQKILAGSTAGAAFNPDDRAEGAALGGGLAGAGQVAEKLPDAVKKLLPKNPYKVIQSGYDKKKETASNLFQSAAKEVNAAGAKIKLPSNLISEIIKIGPKTDRFKTFVNKAKEGDFNALRKLQTELFHRGERYKSSVLGSDQDLGDLIFEKRAKINDAITHELKEQGLDTAASKVNKARSQWKNLEETYHSNNAISKLVGPNREVPSNFKLLKKDAVDINRLKQQHPEIDKYLKTHKYSKAIAGTLATLGLGGGLTTAYNKTIG